MNRFLFVAREAGKLQKADDQAECSPTKKKKEKKKSKTEIRANFRLANSIVALRPRNEFPSSGFLSASISRREEAIYRQKCTFRYRPKRHAIECDGKRNFHLPLGYHSRIIMWIKGLSRALVSRCFEAEGNLRSVEFMFPSHGGQAKRMAVENGAGKKFLKRLPFILLHR